MDDIYPGDESYSEDAISDDDSSNLVDHSPKDISRRTVSGYLLGTVGLLTLAAVTNPKWALKASGSTIPDPTPTPTPIATATPTPEPTISPEEDMETFKAYIAEVNYWLGVNYSQSLILPKIDSTAEVDWEMAKASWDFWGASAVFLPQIEVPSPVNLRSTTNDISFIATYVGDNEYDLVPPPIGLHKSGKENTADTECGWELVEPSDGYVYYASTINGKKHDNAVDGIEKFKIGSLTPFEISDAETTLEYEFVRSTSEKIRKLIEYNPSIANEVRIATLDGYVSIEGLFNSSIQIGGISVEDFFPNVRTLAVPFDEPLYKGASSEHNALTISIVLGNGKCPGLLGSNAGLEIVANDSLGTLIEDRLHRRDAGETLPITFVNEPYHVVFISGYEFTVHGVSYPWNSKEALQFLYDLNIVVVLSWGNTSKFMGGKEHEFDWSNPEIVELFKKTHLVAAKGVVTHGNTILVDPNKGRPNVDDTTMAEASYVTPGRFPAMSFNSYLIRIPDTEVPDKSLYGGYQQGMIPVQISGGGSSFAVTYLASVLVGYSMAHIILAGRTDIAAHELLTSFNEDMKLQDIPIFNNGKPIEASAHLKLVDQTTVNKKLDEAIAKLKVDKTFIPTLHKATG